MAKYKDIGRYSRKKMNVLMCVALLFSLIFMSNMGKYTFIGIIGIIPFLKSSV